MTNLRFASLITMGLALASCTPSLPPVSTGCGHIVPIRFNTQADLKATPAPVRREILRVNTLLKGKPDHD